MVGTSGAQTFQSLGDLDLRFAFSRQEGALLDLRVDWLSVHASREAEEIVMSRLRHGDRHVHASRHIRHREGDDGFVVRVRQVTEAIGDLDRCRRKVELLGDEGDLVRLFERKAAGLEGRGAVVGARGRAGQCKNRQKSKTKARAALEHHAFAAFCLRFASVRKRSALSLMNPPASRWS
jgi:hypothetical protein